MSIALNTLFRQGHPLLINPYRFKEEELVLNGNISLGMVLAATSRALYEILHESVVTCRYMNKVHPTETISAISYVKEVRDIINSGGLEELTMVTIGLRNVDPMTDLANVDIPTDLFLETMDRQALEEFLEENCPVLAGNKVILVAERVILRHAPQSHLRDMATPLL